MAERDPIDLIKDQLTRLEGMADLHPDNEVFKHWYSETKMILEKVFSSKSIHSQNFLALRFREVSIKVFSSPEIDKINATRYKKDLEAVRNVLQSAIKELTLDRTLFKKIQTTPWTVEVSIKGECFISSGIVEPEMIQAIESALQGSGLRPIYAGETIQKEDPLRSRMDQIRRARSGIYDLSATAGAYALIELGMALGLGKVVTVICMKKTPLPDGVRQLNLIEYENPSDIAEKLRGKMG